MRIDDLNVPVTGDAKMIGNGGAPPDFVTQNETLLGCTATYVQGDMETFSLNYGNSFGRAGLVCEMEGGRELFLQLESRAYNDRLGAPAEIAGGPILYGEFEGKSCEFLEVPSKDAELQTSAQGSIHLNTKVVDPDFLRKRSFRRIYEAQPRLEGYPPEEYECPVFRIEFDWTMMAEARDVNFYEDVTYCGH